MDPIGHLKAILTELGQGVGSESSTDWLEGQLISRADEGTIILDRHDQDALKGVLDVLHRRYSRRNQLSRREIERSVHAALFTVLDPKQKRGEDLGERVHLAVRSVREVLERPPVTFDWWIPVRNLDQNDLPASFADCDFGDLNGDVEISIRKVVSDSLPRVPAGMDEMLERARESRGWTDSVVRVRVIASDSDAARDLAVQHATAMVDVLNFFADLIPYHHGRLYLPGWAARENVTSVAVRHGQSISIPQTRAGPLTNYSLKRLRKVKSLDEPIAVAERLLSDGAERAEFKETVLSAISWAGRAAIARGREDAFLLYAIALEALMLPEQDPRELGYRLGLRAAVLIERTAERRRALQVEIADLYRIRSKIVHSGHFQVTEEEVHRVRFLSKAAIIRVLLDRDLQQCTTRKEAGQLFEHRIIS